MPTIDAQRPSVRLALTAVGVALVLFATFPHRLEYLAHVLAGIGLAGVGLAVIGAAASGSGGHDGGASGRAGRQVAGVVAGVWIAAGLAEVTFAGPPEVLDVANTVMGALLGVAAVSGAPRRIRAGIDGEVSLAAVGAALLFVSILVRYPVQETVKHWWWFGS